MQPTATEERPLPLFSFQIQFLFTTRLLATPFNQSIFQPIRLAPFSPYTDAFQRCERLPIDLYVQNERDDLIPVNTRGRMGKEAILEATINFGVRGHSI